MSKSLPKKKKPLKREFYEVDHHLNYKYVKFDDNGWAPNSNYKPLPYDLVLIEVYDVVLKKKRAFRAWWTANEWWGCRLRKKHVVLKWKRLLYGA
jgi:hypothetical protein